MTSRVVLALGVVASILLQGCMLTGDRSDSVQPLPQAVWETDRLVFTDRRLGYQLELPPDWSITSKGGESISYNEVLTRMMSPECMHANAETLSVRSCAVIDVVMIADNVEDELGYRELLLTPQKIDSSSTSILQQTSEDANGIPLFLTEFQADGYPQGLDATVWMPPYVVSFGTHNTPEMKAILRTIRSTDSVEP